MSYLSVYHQSSPADPHKVLTHRDDIVATLAEHGVRFERCRADAAIQPGGSGEDVIGGCREQVDRLMTEHGFAASRVISVDEVQAHMAEFNDEHVHAAVELCWFVAGGGQLTLRSDDFIFAVQCDRHYLVTIPSGMRRWFDLGEQARCAIIRLFRDEQGAQPSFTGDSIARQLPRCDD